MRAPAAASAPLIGSAKDGCSENITLEIAYVMSWLYAPRRKTVHWCVWSAFAAILPLPTLKAMDPYEIGTNGELRLLAISPTASKIDPHVKTAKQ